MFIGLSIGIPLIWILFIMSINSLGVLGAYLIMFISIPFFVFAATSAMCAIDGQFLVNQFDTKTLFFLNLKVVLVLTLFWAIQNLLMANVQEFVTRTINSPGDEARSYRFRRLDMPIMYGLIGLIGLAVECYIAKWKISMGEATGFAYRSFFNTTVVYLFLLSVLRIYFKFAMQGTTFKDL